MQKSVIVFGMDIKEVEAKLSALKSQTANTFKSLETAREDLTRAEARATASRKESLSIDKRIGVEKLAILRREALSKKKYITIEEKIFLSKKTLTLRELNDLKNAAKIKKQIAAGEVADLKKSVTAKKFELNRLRDTTLLLKQGTSSTNKQTTAQDKLNKSISKTSKSRESARIWLNSFEPKSCLITATEIIPPASPPIK